MTPAREIAPGCCVTSMPGAATRNLSRKARTVDISLPHHPACRRRNAPSRHASPHSSSLAGHVAVLAEIMVRAYETEGLPVPAGLAAACATGTPAPRLRLIPGGSP